MGPAVLQHVIIRLEARWQRQTSANQSSSAPRPGRRYSMADRRFLTTLSELAAAFEGSRVVQGPRECACGLSLRSKVF